MIGKLRPVVSPLMMTSVPSTAANSLLPMAAVPIRMISVPIRMISVPLLLAGFMTLSVVGCAETEEEPDAPEMSEVPEMRAAPEEPDAPEMSAAPETPADATAPEMRAAPEEPEAPEMSEVPEMRAAPEEPEAPEEPAASPPAMPSHEPVYLTSEATESMNLPFSDAVRTGHLLFLSGQIGMVPETKELAPGGIQEEARQTMENIKTVLETNGSSMDRVIKATVMLADISEWPAFNEVYVTYFPGHKPARSAFAGSGLAFGARCEVEVIATVGE